MDAPVPLLALAIAMTAVATGAALPQVAPPAPEPLSQPTPFPSDPRPGDVLPDRLPDLLGGPVEDTRNRVDTLGCAEIGYATRSCEEWSARYAGSAGGEDIGEDVTFGPDGDRVFVTGPSWGGDPQDGGTARDYATAAYEAGSGDELWVDRRDGPASLQDWSRAVATGPLGELVYVTGWSEAAEKDGDALTVAYEADTGEVRWSDRFQGPSGGWDDGEDIVVSPDGNRVYVTGYSWGGDPDGGGTGDDFLTIAYDAQSGDRLWVHRDDADGGASPKALDLGPDGDRLFVTGYTNCPGCDYRTVAYDAHTGEELWADQHGEPWADTPEDVVVGPDGDRVHVTGKILVRDEDWNYGTLTYNATTGTRIWTRLYDDAASLDAANAVDVDPAGDLVFVTGETKPGPPGGLSRDMTTIAYDAGTGEQRWLARASGPYPWNFKVGLDLAAGPGGKCLYVTGVSSGLTVTFGYKTIAYNLASGDERWTKRYPGTPFGGDVPWALDVGPAGDKVTVTGESWGVRSADIATVAYEGGC